MDRMLLNKLHMFSLWCVVIYMTCLATGIVLADFLPPLEPSADAETIALHFRENITGIRIGMILIMFGSGFYIPYVALTAYHLGKLEGGFGVLSASQIMGGFAFALMTFYPAGWWLFGSFRLDSPEVIQGFNDASWLSWIGLYFIFLPQLGTIAVSAFVDKRENPVFPRWMGYATVWTAIVYLPSQLCFFFYDGVFAWDGLLTFWLGVVVFPLWTAATFVCLRRAVLVERSEILSSKSKR